MPQQPMMGPPQQQQYGSPLQASTIPPGFNPGVDPGYTTGYNNYPHPGKMMTDKQLWSRYATIYIAGIVTAGIGFFFFFAKIVAIADALAGV